MTAPVDAGPAELVPPGGIPQHAPFSTRQNPRADHAGFASRFIAFVFDCAVSIGVFMLVLGAASFAASVLTGGSIHWHRGSLWVVLAFWGWEFFYYAYFWTASGKTPGMTLLGVASCSGVTAARCTTASPAPRLSMRGTRGRRGFGPSPARAEAGSRKRDDRLGGRLSKMQAIAVCRGQIPATGSFAGRVSGDGDKDACDPQRLRKDGPDER